MWSELLRDHLRTTRTNTLWWAFGLAVYVALTWAFYPTVRANPDISSFMERLPEALRQAFGAEDFVSPGGYAWARMFSLLLPVTLAIYAIRAGTRAIAGDEEEGRLELPLAQPVTRTELLVARTLALAVNLAALGLTVLVANVVFAAIVDAALPVARLGYATLGLVLLAWTLGAVALAVGTASGRAGLASGVAFAVTLASYLVHNLAPQVETLRSLRGFTPFWYGVGENSFRGDLHPERLTVLLAAGALLVLLATPRFLRRDVG